MKATTIKKSYSDIHDFHGSFDQADLEPGYYVLYGSRLGNGGLCDCGVIGPHKTRGLAAEHPCYADGYGGSFVDIRRKS